MLVLTRRIDERIVLDLGDGRLVWVTVCEVRRGAFQSEGSRVRIGVEATADVKVWREELWNEMEAAR